MANFLLVGDLLSLQEMKNNVNSAVCWSVDLFAFSYFKYRYLE